jgi:hypothetical protein
MTKQRFYIESNACIIVNPMAVTPTNVIQMGSSPSTKFHPSSFTNGRSSADDSVGPPGRVEENTSIHIHRIYASSTWFHPFTDNSMGATILESFRRRLCIRRSIVAATFF